MPENSTQTIKNELLIFHGSHHAIESNSSKENPGSIPRSWWVTL
jgi:hypothetical protein